jgi:predicted membrane channel-forming protein YqfA (hemolysin III family)
MADVENPEVAAVAVAAEPEECSRRMLVCAMGFVFFALVCVFSHTVELQESHPESTGAAVIAVGGLAFLVGLCFFAVFMILVNEWIRGNPEFPEGHRFVDDLLQSDRFILCESVHQFMRRMDQPGDA